MPSVHAVKWCKYEDHTRISWRKIACSSKNLLNFIHKVNAFKVFLAPVYGNQDENWYKKWP